MTTNRTADTVFSGKGTDLVLAADVYNVKSSENKNFIFDSINRGAAEAADFINQNPESIRNLINVATDLRKGYLTPMDAISRIGYGMNSNTLQKLGKKATGMATTIANSMGLTPELVNKIKVSIGGAVSYIGGDNLPAVREYLDIAGDLINDSDLTQFFDIEAEASVLSGVLGQGYEYGMPDILDTVRNTGRYDDLSLKAAAKSISPIAIASGSIKGVKSLLDFVTVDDVLGESPNAVKDIASNFKLPEGTTPDEYPALGSELGGVLEQFDQNWYKVKVGEREVVNYDVLSQVSEDAKKVFMLNETYRPILMTAPFYQPSSVKELAKTLYPRSAYNASK